MIESSSIKAAALQSGFSTVGVCRPTTLEFHSHYDAWLTAGFAAEMEYLHRHRAPKFEPDLILEGARSVVVAGAFYGGEPGPLNGRVARYARGRDYHRVLKRRLEPVVAEIARLDPESRNRICVDSLPTPDRYWAHRAGLGWFGKNTMLIDSQRGSWFLIGLILTTAELETDTPALGGCGTCRSCIDACPTGAIVQLEGRWSVDSRRCISYQTIENRSEEIPDPHGRIFGCDICQEVCPFNTPRATQPLRAVAGGIQELSNREEPPRSPLEMSEEEWDLWTRGSARRRATFRMWRRNAKGGQS